MPSVPPYVGLPSLRLPVRSPQKRHPLEVGKSSRPSSHERADRDGFHHVVFRLSCKQAEI